MGDIANGQHFTTEARQLSGVGDAHPQFVAWQTLEQGFGV